MGAFRYCCNNKCQTGLSKPSAAEDLRDGQHCYACGEEQPQFQSAVDWAIELDNRVADLESEIQSIKEKLQNLGH